MEPYDSGDEFGDLKISQDAIIATVAEDVLNSNKAITVVDDKGDPVGSLHASHVVNVLFGRNKDNTDGQS